MRIPVRVFSRGNGQFAVLRLGTSKTKIQQGCSKAQTHRKFKCPTNRSTSSCNSRKNREKGRIDDKILEASIETALAQNLGTGDIGASTQIEVRALPKLLREV